MRRMRNAFTVLWIGLGVAALAGCAQTAVPLENLTGQGQKWVWPFFLDGKPTVLAFWTTNEVQCLRDIPALKALEARDVPVQLITAVTGRDALEVEKWVRRERIRYPVLLDLDERLARKLGVWRYPTFLYFDSEGQEIGRAESVVGIRDWFDDASWLKRAGAVPDEPTAGRAEPIPPGHRPAVVSGR